VDPSTSIGSRKQERTTLLLLLILLPMFSVMLIAALGFAIWFWQMFASGPPHV
jgi:nitrate reductase NapE